MSSQQPLTELAKQGDTTAIAALLSQHFQPQNIAAKTTLKDSCLKIVLESAQTPEQKTAIEIIRQQIGALQSPEIKSVKVYGKQSDEEFPDWQEDLSVASESGNSLFGSMFGAIASAASVVTGTAAQVGNAVVGTAVGVSGAVGSTAMQAGGAVTGAVVGTAGAVGNAAAQTGDAIAGAGGAIANTVMQAPTGLGHLVDAVSDSPLLRQTTKALQVDWLINLISQVDIVKAETKVRKLQQKYPQDKPNEIAHRIMVEKALYVGGTGLTSSLLPGFASAMFAVDLVATTALQAEMVYQIACAYGLDLRASERKGEVLAIFGMAFGGQAAIKAGLGLLRNVPMAGAAIGASSNAVMLYALGHAACQFYEAKLNPTMVPPTLAETQAENEKYLQAAIAQEVIMDQILVHLMVAGKPNSTWWQVFPELQQMNLSPASLEAIAANLQAPPTLDSLLDQINPDFAVSLVAQCQKIAQSDGVVTDEEAEIIKRINEKFNADQKPETKKLFGFL